MRCGWLKFTLKNLGPLIILIVYAFAGAFVFRILEQQDVARRDNAILRARIEAKAIAVERLAEIKGLTVVERQQTDELLTWYGEILDPWGGNNTEEEHWSFAGSLFYVSTILSTIGYGNITPVTNMGRLVSIIYSLIGVPLSLYATIKCGVFLSRLFISIANLNSIKDSDEDDFNIIMASHSWILMFLPPLCILGIVAMVVILENEWDYIVCIYYTIISVTTIGFGDVVPSTNATGLAAMVIVLVFFILTATIYAVAQAKIGALFKLIKHLADRERKIGEMVPLPQPPYFARQISFGRFWYFFMSDDKKEQLEEYLELNLKN